MAFEIVLVGNIVEAERLSAFHGMVSLKSRKSFSYVGMMLLKTAEAERKACRDDLI